MGLLVGISLMMISILVFALMLSLIEYFAHSLFLYTLASAKNMNKKYLAWIPIVQDFYMCDVVKNVAWNQAHVNNYAITLAIGIAVSVFGGIVGVGWFAGIGVIITIAIMFMLYEKIFSVYAPDVSAILAILCIIKPISTIVEIVFVIKGWKLDCETGYCEQQKEKPTYNNMKNDKAPEPEIEVPKAEVTEEVTESNNPYQE